MSTEQEIAELKETKKPDDHLKVTFGFEDEEVKEQELFMSAGLIRRLAAMASVQKSLTDLYMNPTLQAWVICEVLTPRNKRGQATENITLDDFVISPSEADKVQAWATNHILAFFTKAILETEMATVSEGSNLMKLLASMTGLQALLEKKQSVGPSEQESVTSQ